MALSLESIINSYVDLEKAKVGARLAATGPLQAAGLGTVNATANPQAKAGGVVLGVAPRTWMIGGAVVLAGLGLVYWIIKK